jgi:hypothetical protein
MASEGDRIAQSKYKCLAADNWSLYPAKGNVDLDCYALTYVQSATFCDGTYLGPGGSFDISSSHNIAIKSTGDIDITADTGDITMTVGNPAGSIIVPYIASATTANILYYDSVTGKVSQGAKFPAITVQAATGTIALTAAMDRSTYILTGTSATQTFTSAGLAGVAAGYCVYLRNGNNATGLTRDITITIPAGNTTLHAPTGTTNSSYILLYWTGSALVAYR